MTCQHLAAGLPSWITCGLCQPHARLDYALHMVARGRPGGEGLHIESQGAGESILLYRQRDDEGPRLLGELTCDEQRRLVWWATRSDCGGWRGTIKELKKWIDACLAREKQMDGSWDANGSPVEGP